MSILVLKEKHGDRHFSFNTPEELRLLAAHIVRERQKEGYFYEDAQHDKLLIQALKGDNQAALRFLHNRSDYEYEGIETVEPETLETLKEGDII